MNKADPFNFCALVFSWQKESATKAQKRENIINYIRLFLFE